MTEKKSPDVVIKPKDPQFPEHKMEVGEAVKTADSLSTDGMGAGTAPFSPQVMDMNEKVEFANPMELEAFMHDWITIQTFPPMDENMDRVITFRVRDKVQNIVLGTTQRVGRWCVEAMARCRNSFVKGNYTPVSQSSEQHVYSNHTSLNTKALKHPFSVLEDPAGAKGARYLSQVLRDRL